MDKRVGEILSAMRGKRIVVLGDMIADVYLMGKIARISREAPVLVLEHAGERIVAGGASNVVHNVATLGGRAIAAGVLGADAAADGLKAILAEKGVETEGLLTDEARPTISKTRVIAGGRETVSQQIVRVDREDRSPLSEKIAARLREFVLRAAESADGVVISDYGGAAVTEALAREVLTHCRRLGVPTMVDSRYAIRRFLGVDYVKQNDAELAAAMKRELSSEVAIREAGEALRTELDAKGVLVTRGAKGMTLLMAEGVTDIPVTDKSEVFDVSGAGDTCVAAFMLAVAAGATPRDAACLANVAAGIAVRKLGTATVSAEELRAAAERQLGSMS